MRTSLAFLLWLATAASSATLPAGTQLQLRLTTEASSDQPSGAPVSAVVIVTVFLNGAPVLPAGTQLSGTTADATPFRAAGNGTAEQASTLRLQFTTIADATGHSKPLSATVTAIDNAREVVDANGLIKGIAQSQTMEAQIDRGINKVASQYGQFAQILSGMKGAFLKEVNASVDYKSGVELTIRLTQPLAWTSPESNRLPPAITPAEALRALVNREPFRTLAQSPPKPSDLTNLMFIGSAQQLESAFREAGWFAANALSRSSKMETARALIEDRGYNEAPMSVLFLDSRPPDLAMQKQNDTFAMRHHIRIWQRPETFHGKPVWVAAATHDTSITFSPESRSFTHAIDPNIDLERAKVVNDLLFTQKAQGIALVERTGIPQDLSNATGDRLITDGSMAVVEF